VNLLTSAAWLAALFVLAPCAILACECLAACLPPRRRRLALVRVPRLVVLVPAHDEEDCISEALRTITPELGEGDRALVVAHNCGDRTAMIARARGAEVLEVRDEGTGGKPDALKAGLRHLDADPPEVVVVVDADCRAERGALRTLAMAAAESGGPVQGDYRFAAGEAGDFGALSSLAVLLKNVVRPLGLTRLGLPCLLNGAGSAYPFEQLRHAPHGEGSIAEDYQLAIDLAERGHRTRFVPEARVRSVLPARREAALRQRRRWEHGHLRLVFLTAPRLVLRGLLRLDLGRLALGLDLLVPPLAFLAMGWAASAALALAALFVRGERAPLLVVLTAGALFAAGVGSGVARHGGPGDLARTMRAAPAYVGAKLALYLEYFTRRETRWRKTERPSGSAALPAEEKEHERTGTGT
jgi:hypothetical protein